MHALLIEVALVRSCKSGRSCFFVIGGRRHDTVTAFDRSTRRNEPDLNRHLQNSRVPQILVIYSPKMNPMDYPDYEPTYADLGIDPNNPNEGYYSSDDGESGPGDSATGSDYAETEEYDSDHSEEDIFELESQVY